MLELSGVTKVYKTGGLVKLALDKVSVNFRKSEFVAILGPSGSGKTTLLNIIGGLDQYTDGDLKINEISTKRFKDKDWDAYRNHRIGFVFQSYNLIPHQTVLSNVKLALTLSGISKKEATRRAKQALSDVGLGDQFYKKPNQLSGGQMQRVAIARALVNNPDILLADEPTGALDSVTSLQIMRILKKISRKRLVIMVTHNPDLANKYATRIINLKDGKITTDSKKYNGKINTKLLKEEDSKKRRKTKMTFFTALSLSLNNLFTKKLRTILVAFAGSIGIIGIALILAVSTGFQSYIDTIQADTLTSYPLYIQKESTNMTGTILGAVLESTTSENDGLVHENPILTKALGSITNNDLKKFNMYIDNHRSEIDGDVRLMENFYSVDPAIYSIDAAGELVQLNPSTLFTTLLGDSSILSSYSTMTSIYRQYDKSLLEDDMRILSGRLPEKYNEMVIILTKEGRIADLVTYSLGLRDTGELSAVLAKLINNESVALNEEPLTLTYEDLMNVKLRLINTTDMYKYNATYNIYENLSENKEYMRKLYDEAEELKIVGVVTPKDDLVSAMSGVAYMPELVEHIINRAKNTDIVKNQLANPSIDIFSNTKFSDKTSELSKLKFENLVSIDRSKIERAFSFNLDKNELKTKAKDYIISASKDLIKQVVDEFKELEPMFKEKAEELRDKILKKLNEMLENEEIDFSKMTEEEILELFKETADEIIKETDFEDLKKEILEFDIEKRINQKIDGLINYLSTVVRGSFSVDQAMLASAFKMNFDDDELARIFSAMFNKTEKTLASNLAILGYQALDDPTYIAFYFKTFEGKTRFLNFIDRYNDMMKSYNQEDSVIEYSDTTGILMTSVKVIVDAVSYVLIAFVSISLVVSSIMIGIITYISVYERTKEIGILRAIGASKHNISSIFNAETFIVGLLSGLIGIGLSYSIIPIINLVLAHFTADAPGDIRAILLPNAAFILIALSVILTLIGGLMPARAAAKKDPVEALRSE